MRDLVDLTKQNVDSLDIKIDATKREIERIKNEKREEENNLKSL